MSTENQKSGDSRLDQVIAGEYVLGVLSDEDRRKVEARMMLDRNFAAIVDHWQSNLLKVDSTPRRPSGRAARPEPQTPARPKLAPSGMPPVWNGAPLNAALWESARFWRTVAGIATLGLLAVVVFQSSLFSVPAAGPKRLSAPLDVEGAPFSLAAAFDASTGALDLAPATDGAHSLQLWSTDGGTPSVSLGILGTNAAGQLVVPPAARSRIRDGSNLALSLEPAGGSPSGVPTGQILARSGPGVP